MHDRHAGSSFPEYSVAGLNMGFQYLFEFIYLLLEVLSGNTKDFGKSFYVLGPAKLLKVETLAASRILFATTYQHHMLSHQTCETETMFERKN